MIFARGVADAPCAAFWTVEEGRVEAGDGEGMEATGGEC